MFARVLIVGSLIVLGCGAKDEERRIGNVVQVFMHEPNRYTIVVQDQSSHSVQMETFAVETRDGVKILTDVPSSERMWAFVRREYRFGMFGFVTVLLELHIHAPQNLEGGGWDHGKHGRGRTNVLQ